MTSQEKHAESPVAPPRRDRDYPSAAELRRVRTLKDPNRALDALRAAWIDDYGSVSDKLSVAEWAVVHIRSGDRHVRLATGGWSGNEDLIRAFAQNTIAWGVTWRLSARGGLYIFRYLSVAEQRRSQ